MQPYIIFLVVFSFTWNQTTGLSLREPIIENVIHLQTALPPPDTAGIWRKKLIWKARWVQEYRSEKKWHPVWRKVWSPYEIREWLPLPRPPPPDLVKPNPSYPPIELPSHPPPNPEAQDPAPFRPINSYGAPVNPSPSTALHPVPDEPPAEWPAPDMQELLENYHTIRDAEPLLQPRNPNNGYGAPQNSSLPLRDEPRKNSVSPYAAKLAQAVLREKFNQSLNPTERPSGLTDVIFNPTPTSTTSKPTELLGKSTTENPSNVFIVTPVSFG